MNLRFFLFFATLTLYSTPAFARGSDGSATFFAFVIGAGAIYWFFSAAVASRVEKVLLQRKAEIESKARAERAAISQHAENERAKTVEHASVLAADIKRKRDDLYNASVAFHSSYIEGRTWLAEFIAEAFQAPDEALAQALETKKHPAHKAAADVRRVSLEKKGLLRKLKYLEYALKTYHEYYPVLEQYSEDILNETASLNLDDEDPEADHVSYYISKEEYEKLKPVERNQKALDNWVARRKSNVEIGRLYERYLGYLYEVDGWTVTYFGAIEGLEDMGRDLICIKGSSLHIVQAKYWAKHKVIHEKHIFQLYGTTVLLPLTKPDLKEMRVTPVFAATTRLSETARWAAKALNVIVKAQEMDHMYPMIKCNVNGSNKIYHLPIDQQYDRVRIDTSRGEFYVKTTAEAEKLGFRRAMRHSAYANM
jgi:hypothetical protein